MSYSLVQSQTGAKSKASRKSLMSQRVLRSSRSCRKKISVSMATIANRTGIARKPISNLRWWIGGLLFASTVINYIDRQTLSVLGPYLETQYQWNNQQFAL